MLHIGTLAALLIYYGRDWLRIVPAGFAVIRDRSFRDDPDRRLAWLLVAATIPAAIVGALFNDVIETTLREIGLVALMLVVGAVILWLADRWGGTSRRMSDITFPVAVGIGAAQVLSLVPGISRSGISISAGRLAGLDRAAAARFSFLMATPITAGAVLFEARQLADRGGGRDAAAGPAGGRPRRIVRVRHHRHPGPAGVRPNPIAQRLRRLSPRVRGAHPRRLARALARRRSWRS